MIELRLNDIMGISELIRRHIRKKDDSAIAILLSQATEASQRGDLASALNVYVQMLELRPKFAEGYYRRANILNRLGRADDALIDYDRAVAIDPLHAHAWCNRGTVLEKTGRLQEALVSQDRAISLDPQDHVSYYNRGSVQAALGMLADSVVSFDMAISLKQDYVEALINRGNSLSALRDNDAALASYDDALRIHPRAAEAHLGRGVILFRRLRLTDAIGAYTAAIGARSDYGAAYRNRGNAFMELRQFGRALSDYDRLIQLEPESAINHEARGNAAINLRLYSEAMASYDRALAIDPDSKYLLCRRRHFKMQFCDWAGLEDDLKTLREGVDVGKHACVPFQSLTLFDDARLHRKTAELWALEECSPETNIGPISQPDSGERIRLAYFSADFRNHAVSILTAQLFESHDRARFEIFAFAFGPPSEDAMTLRLRGSFDQFIDIRALDDEDAARLCRNMSIDIAIDLGGYTEYSRSKIFAMRVAPVQVSFLGYPGTSGAAFMDYIICDATVIPERLASDYSEKRIVLPHSYLPHDSGRIVSDKVWTRTECGLAEAAFVFCGFHNSYKILPATFRSWMRILTAVPQSILWLADAGADPACNLRQEAKRRGVDPTRLVFAPRLPFIGDHLARQRAADLFLDTLPYNAHTSAMDALWAGLPVLTLAGEAFAGRVGAGLLNAVGMPELIATSLADYEYTAIRLAKDPAATAALTKKLRGIAHSSALFDSQRYVRNLESAYDEIHRRYRQGLPPSDVLIR